MSFFGWVRGASYRINNKVHIIGLGDYEIANTEVVEDPVPLVVVVEEDLKEENEDKI